jgi:hypothetical protein
MTIQKFQSLAQYNDEMREAKSAFTSIERLEELAENESWDIRARVAKNPNSSPELLAQLSDDTDDDVLCGVAENPATPVHVMLYLSGSGKLTQPECIAKIMRYLASNPSCPADLLVNIYKADAWDCRRRVCENPNCPPELRDHYIVKEAFE